MESFNPHQKQFLEEISKQENEDDWVRIPGYVKLVEKKIDGKVVGLAGVTLRYKIIPSLFIATSAHIHGKGVGTELLGSLLQEWKGPLFLTYYQKKTHLGKFYGKFGFKKIFPWFGKRNFCVRF